MFNSNNKKISNVKNTSHTTSFNKTTELHFESPIQEHTFQTYVPHDEYNYMQVNDVGSLQCPFGISPQNTFPLKEQWGSTADKERGDMPFEMTYKPLYSNQEPLNFEQNQLTNYLQEPSFDFEVENIEFQHDYDM